MGHPIYHIRPKERKEEKDEKKEKKKVTRVHGCFNKKLSSASRQYIYLCHTTEMTYITPKTL